MKARFPASPGPIGEPLPNRWKHLPAFESKDPYRGYNRRPGSARPGSERRQAVISFDTETTSTDEMTASLVGISVAVKPGQGYYIPVGHHLGTQLPLEQVLSALRRSLQECPHTQDRP